MATAYIEAWGGGASGGATTTADASGGGGGAYARLNAFTLASGTGYTVTIGAGGAAKTPTGNGNGGGDTSFSSTATLLAKGGSAGNQGSNPAVGGGGTTAASIGDVKFAGGNGGGDNASNAGGGGGGGAGSTAVGGNGGAASGTTGGTGGTGGSVGGGNGSAGAGKTVAGASTATAPGGGGGGAGGWSGGHSGAGAAGQVKITVPLGVVTSATGGTHTTDSVNDYWTFTASGTWTPTITAFPVAGTPTPTAFATSVTSMAVSLPTVVTGDLLVALVEARNAATWTKPTGWNDILTVAQAGGGATGKLNGFYRICDGTEGTTATWTASTGSTAAWQVVRIVNWHGTTPPEGGTASGDATNADPPSLTPSWGADNDLWLAVAGNAATGETTGFTAAPTSYTGLQSNGASTGGSTANIATATRQLNATSENPGTFTPSSNRFWAAGTIAVRPIVSGGGGGATDTLQGYLPMMGVGA